MRTEPDDSARTGESNDRAKAPCFSCGDRIEARDLAVFDGINFHRTCFEDELGLPRQCKTFPSDERGDQAA